MQVDPNGTDAERLHALAVNARTAALATVNIVLQDVNLPIELRLKAAAAALTATTPQQPVVPPPPPPADAFDAWLEKISDDEPAAAAPVPDPGA